MRTLYCASLSALLLLLFVLHWHFFCLSLSMGCRMTSVRTVQRMFLPQKPNCPQKKSCRSRSALHVQEREATWFNRRKETDDDATDVLLSVMEKSDCSWLWFQITFWQLQLDRHRLKMSKVAERWAMLLVSVFSYAIDLFIEPLTAQHQ